MGMVRDLCPHVILLNYSEQIYAGDCKRAINIFHKIDRIKKNLTPTNSNVNTSIDQAIKSIGWHLENQENKDAVITHITLAHLNGESSNKFQLGDKIRIAIHIKARKAGIYATSIAIKNKNEQLITSSGCQTLGIPPCQLDSNEKIVFKFIFEARIEAGLYTFKVYLGTPSNTPNRGGILVDETAWSPPFEITWDYENVNAPFLGMFGPPTTACYQKS
jgi:hypothetical protein